MIHSPQYPLSRRPSITLLWTLLLVLGPGLTFSQAGLAQEPPLPPDREQTEAAPLPDPPPDPPLPEEVPPTEPDADTEEESSLLDEQDPEEELPVPEPPVEPVVDEAEVAEEVLTVPAPRRSENPCEVGKPRDEARLDKFRRGIFETVCEAAAGFDGFFGSRRFDEEARRTHGRAGARVILDEHEGVKLDGTLKVKVDFPNLDHRLNAFLGREERDEFLTGDEGDLNFLPSFFEREGGEEWLIGLGYRPVSNDRSALDFDVGVDIDSNIDPFVRTRYRYYWLVGNDNLLRARETVYYSDHKGLGSATRVDYERPLGWKTLARVSANLVFDDETQGGDWNSGITLYRGFTPNSAVAWYVGINGETGKEVPLEDYGTRITYRQRMLREWFFGEILTGVTWPRDNLQQTRERAYHFGVGFEIQFSGEDLFRKAGAR
ncbi:MAG: hypothetical protein LC732_01305, partial [Acidobacteria bacterium]|nr:hypothetical protein [Acidobacteriota bacterium]